MWNKKQNEWRFTRSGYRPKRSLPERHVMPMNRQTKWMIRALVFCCLIVPAISCDFGSADGWNVIVPEKVEWRDTPFSNVVVAINGLLAKYTTNNPPFSLKVVREKDGKSEIVTLSSPLFPNQPVTFTGAYNGIGCIVKIIASVSGQVIARSTKQGPLWIIVEEQQRSITNEFSGSADPFR